MPKIKIPERLHQIADELNVDLGAEVASIDDAEELINWVPCQLHEQRQAAVEAYDAMEADLDDIETEMLESADAEDAT